jgi:pSer/pThr/pTyr-binding forkhead associated (FHA) protein
VPPDAEDAVHLALLLPRNLFVARFPEPILVGDGALASEVEAQQMKARSEIGWESTKVGGKSPPTIPRIPIVCPVRKVRKNYPRMITVGRTPHNDVPIPDNAVSKLHAFFKIPRPDRELWLSDNGSLNGTFVDEMRLTPHAPPVMVAMGARVRFAAVAFTLFSSGMLWDTLHQANLIGSSRSGTAR